MTPKINKRDRDTLCVVHPPACQPGKTSGNRAVRSQYGHYYGPGGEYLWTDEVEHAYCVKKNLCDHYENGAVEDDDEPAIEGNVEKTEEEKAQDIENFDFAGYLDGTNKQQWFTVKAAILHHYKVDVNNKKQALEVIKNPPEIG